MADEVLKRDQNYVTVGAGVSNDSDVDISILRVDPVTKKLLVTISSVVDGVGASTQIAKRDENHVPVCLAWNETAEELQEILTDENGNLLCDIEYI